MESNMPKQTTNRTADRETGIWKGTHIPSKSTITVEAWRFLMESVDPLEKGATADQKAAHQAATEKAMESAKAAWTELDERIRFYVLEGVNRDLGDMLNTKGETPVPATRKAYQERLRGVFPSGGGVGGVEPRVKLRRDVLENAAVNENILGRTKAAAMAKDDSAKLIAMIAKARGQTAADYEKAVDAAVAVLG